MEALSERIRDIDGGLSPLGGRGHARIRETKECHILRVFEVDSILWLMDDLLLQTYQLSLMEA